MKFLYIEEIREEFAQFLRKNAHYSKKEAEMAVYDFPSLADNCYLDEKYIDTVMIDGNEYQRCSTWTNFVEHCMVDTKGKTFCFYTFYRMEDVPNKCANEYYAARKLYSVSELRHEDFPWYVVWPN